MSIFFVAHALSFCFLIKYLFISLRIESFFDRRLGEAFSFVLLVTAFTLYPNYYEVLYWPTDMPYILGALLLVGSLYIKNVLVRSIFLSASFLISEMFLAPALCFMLFPFGFLYGSTKDRNVIRRAAKDFFIWVGAVGAYLLIRYVLSQFFGTYPHRISLNPINILLQIKNSTWLTVSLHFYKTYWIQTGIYVLLLVYILFLLLSKKLMPLKVWILSVFFSILSMGIYWALAYSARRALYGSGLFVNALLVLAAYLVLSRTDKTFKKIIFSSLFLLIFISHTLNIFSIKNKNYHVLQGKEMQLVKEISACKEPCKIELSSLDSGLKRDWVLHEDYWIAYAEWIKQKHYPQKKVKFKIAGK